MSSLVAKRLMEMESALKDAGVSFFSEGNVVHTMANNMNIEIVCEIGRYIVTMWDGENESHPERYRAAKTIMREVIL
ncbi:hypothetical protein [Bacillus albus]|uniref:hypothetical protein n=1 Tax=Bacillus albus TaxID=2026189 RepID=UPI001021CE2C|nr:hypothetical protein [Bacillus albus]